MCQDVYVPEVNDATTAAYTNSLILNDHVYVPMAVKGYGKYGREALEVDENAMQNHQLVGIIGKKHFPWLGTDARYCRTHEVPGEAVNNWLKSKKLKVD